MSLSLLAPWALGLFAVAALPVLAHLSKQQPRERVAFGAMLLVRRLSKRLRRRRRLRDPLVLLLRLLAIAALVFAVSGARLSWPGGVPQVGGSGRVVFVVDQSMSMSRVDGGSTLLEREREAALAALRQLPAGTQVGLITFSSEAVRATPQLTDDIESVAARLATLSPTHGTSDLRGALREARRLIGQDPGEVLLFTDEAGPTMVPQAAEELQALVSAGNAVLPEVLSAEPARNTAVVGARYGEGPEGGQVTIRLMSYAPEPVEVRCEVTLPDGARIPIFVDLPPEGEAEERVTVPREAEGGVGEVRCEDPDLPGDDAWHFHLPRVGASRVLLVDGSPGDTPTSSEVYFLERALAPWGGARESFRPDVVPAAGLDALDPAVHRVVFLANVGDPRPFASQLSAFVRGGGALVITGGDNLSPDRYAEALGSLLPAPLRRARSLGATDDDGEALALPEPDEPLFRAFARGGRAGFSRVKVRRLMTFDPYEDDASVHTLLRTSGGLPALVSREVDGGRVVVWASSVDFDWTNLPVQSVYVPFVQQLVGWLGGDAGGAVARVEGRVGEEVSVPLPDRTVEPRVIGPDGQPVASGVQGSKLVFKPDKVGAYALTLDDGPAVGWVAVNAWTEESDVRHLHSVARVEAELAPELFRRTVELGPWALTLGLLALVAQAVLALRGQRDDEAV